MTGVKLKLLYNNTCNQLTVYKKKISSCLSKNYIHKMFLQIRYSIYICAKRSCQQITHDC